MERVIMHCDMNSFFASVELLHHPDLREKPVAVCGDPKSRHGIILAKNEPAKAFGIKTAETIWQARKKCPELILLPPSMGEYQYYSKQVNEIYQRYTDLVEPFGIDESWLDVSGTLHLFGNDGRLLGDEIRRVVQTELGLTVSVGVSFNKIFAKLGSDYKKPNATTVIRQDNFQEIVWPLPITDLLFVGRAAAGVLGKYGVATIGQLANFGKPQLELLLGKQGSLLWCYANGLDDSTVAPAGTYTPPKSVGNGFTFPRNLVGCEEIRTGISALADSVAARLRKHGMKCTTVQVSIRDPKFKNICRQKRLASPTCISREIIKAAMELMSDSWNMGAPIRALTITAQGLIPEREAAEQLDLFQTQSAPQRDKQEKLERTMDEIRRKYGKNAIRSARVAEGVPGAQQSVEEK